MTLNVFTPDIENNKFKKSYDLPLDLLHLLKR